MTPEKFICPHGKIAIYYDGTILVSRVDIRFRTWGACYEERAVSSTADAIQRVIRRVEKEPDTEAVVEAMYRRIEELKQGELFA